MPFFIQAETLKVNSKSNPKILPIQQIIADQNIRCCITAIKASLNFSLMGICLPAI